MADGRFHHVTFTIFNSINENKVSYKRISYADFVIVRIKVKIIVDIKEIIAYDVSVTNMSVKLFFNNNPSKATVNHEMVLKFNKQHLFIFCFQIIKFVNLYLQLKIHISY